MCVIILLLLLVFGSALDNGLGRTPPMGWNSWNHFGCNINETVIKQTADLLVSSGLAAKGYKYVNLDDCWQIGRQQETQEIIADPKKFPSGMAALAQYVHSKGLLFGLYSDAGTKTCQGRPGGYGHQNIDAVTYAKWKIDYLKYDNCHNEGLSPKFRYPLMRNALNRTGRHIYFSMCEWGRERPHLWATPVANSWRTSVDIKDFYLSFLHNLEHQVGLAQYAGPGGWNDPDALEVGNGGMNHQEYVAHFSLWALLKAPLLIGCALKGISNDTLAILGNEEVIAVNQDPLGKQGDLIDRETHQLGFKQVWGGQLSGNRYNVVFFNRNQGPATFNFSLARPEFYGLKVTRIRDIIAHADVALPSGNSFTTKSVKAHGAAHYIFTLKPPSEEVQE